MDTGRKIVQPKRRQSSRHVPSSPLSSSDPTQHVPSGSQTPPASNQKKNVTPFKFLPVGHFDAFPFQPLPEQSPNKSNDNVANNASQQYVLPPQLQIVNIEEFNKVMEYGRNLEQNYLQLQAQLSQKEIELQEIQELRKVDDLEFSDILQNTLRTLIKLNSLLEEQSNVNIDKEIENFSKLSIQSNEEPQNNNNNAHLNKNTNYDNEATHNIRANFRKKAQEQTELLEVRIKELKKKNVDMKTENTTLEKQAKVLGPHGKELLRSSSVVELHKLLSDQREVLRRIEDEIEKKTMEEKACVICLDKDKNTVFVPCGHLVTCWDCSRSLRECPICRENIQQAIRTYLS